MTNGDNADLKKKLKGALAFLSSVGDLRKKERITKDDISDALKKSSGKEHRTHGKSKLPEYILNDALQATHRKKHTLEHRIAELREESSRKKAHPVHEPKRPHYEQSGTEDSSYRVDHKKLELQYALLRNTNEQQERVEDVLVHLAGQKTNLRKIKTGRANKEKYASSSSSSSSSVVNLKKKKKSRLNREVHNLSLVSNMGTADQHSIGPSQVQNIRNYIPVAAYQVPTIPNQSFIYTSEEQYMPPVYPAPTYTFVDKNYEDAHYPRATMMPRPVPIHQIPPPYQLRRGYDQSMHPIYQGVNKPGPQVPYDPSHSRVQYTDGYDVYMHPQGDRSFPYSEHPIGAYTNEKEYLQREQSNLRSFLGKSPMSTPVEQQEPSFSPPTRTIDVRALSSEQQEKRLHQDKIPAMHSIVLKASPLLEDTSPVITKKIPTSVSGPHLNGEKPSTRIDPVTAIEHLRQAEGKYDTGDDVLTRIHRDYDTEHNIVRSMKRKSSSLKKPASSIASHSFNGHNLDQMILRRGSSVSRVSSSSPRHSVSRHQHVEEASSDSSHPQMSRRSMKLQSYVTNATSPSRRSAESDLTSRKSLEKHGRLDLDNSLSQSDHPEITSLSSFKVESKASSLASPSAKSNRLLSYTSSKYSPMSKKQSSRNLSEKSAISGKIVKLHQGIETPSSSLYDGSEASMTEKKVLERVESIALASQFVESDVYRSPKRFAGGETSPSSKKLPAVSSYVSSKGSFIGKFDSPRSHREELSGKVIYEKRPHLGREVSFEDEIPSLLHSTSKVVSDFVDDFSENENVEKSVRSIKFAISESSPNQSRHIEEALIVDKKLATPSSIRESIIGDTGDERVALGVSESLLSSIKEVSQLESSMLSPSASLSQDFKLADDSAIKSVTSVKDLESIGEIPSLKDSYSKGFSDYNDVYTEEEQINEDLESKAYSSLRDRNNKSIKFSIKDTSKYESEFDLVEASSEKNALSLSVQEEQSKNDDMISVKENNISVSPSSFGDKVQSYRDSESNYSESFGTPLRVVSEVQALSSRQKSPVMKSEGSEESLARESSSSYRSSKNLLSPDRSSSFKGEAYSIHSENNNNVSPYGRRHALRTPKSNKIDSSISPSEKHGGSVKSPAPNDAVRSLASVSMNIEDIESHSTPYEFSESSRREILSKQETPSRKWEREISEEIASEVASHLSSPQSTRKLVMEKGSPAASVRSMTMPVISEITLKHVREDDIERNQRPDVISIGDLEKLENAKELSKGSEKEVVSIRSDPASSQNVLNSVSVISPSVDEIAVESVTGTDRKMQNATKEQMFNAISPDFNESLFIAIMNSFYDELTTKNVLSPVNVSIEASCFDTAKDVLQNVINKERNLEETCVIDKQIEKTVSTLINVERACPLTVKPRDPLSPTLCRLSKSGFAEFSPHLVGIACKATEGRMEAAKVITQLFKDNIKKAFDRFTISLEASLYSTRDVDVYYLALDELLCHLWRQCNQPSGLFAIYSSDQAIPLIADIEDPEEREKQQKYIENELLQHEKQCESRYVREIVSQQFSSVTRNDLRLQKEVDNTLASILWPYIEALTDDLMLEIAMELNSNSATFSPL